MKKLYHCPASFPCADCVHYVSCKKKTKIRRLKKRCRLAVFYILYPFVWMIDFIGKIFKKMFSSKGSAVVSTLCIACILALSGFAYSTSSEDNVPLRVYASDSDHSVPAAPVETSYEVALGFSPIPDSSVKTVEPITTSEPESSPSEEVLNVQVAEAATKQAADVAAEIAQEQAKQAQELAAQAAKEAEANQLHENIFVVSTEVASQMGLPSDYDPILAMYGMNYLVSEEGFTVEGAAGLIGNVYSECKFVLDADNGSHFGVFQWDYYDRWPRISAYLEEHGVSHYSRHQDYSGLTKEQECELFVWQLRAALHSSDAGYYTNTIENCKVDSDASSSADRWRRNYEVCDGATAQRMEYAEYTATLYYTIDL